MPVDALDEAATRPWLDVLDTDEQQRAARFVFSRDRVAFIAAHALVRVVLSEIVVEAAPHEWRFIPGERGKPLAYLDARPAPLSFNLSHTAGMVGVAVLPLPGHAVGFDVEWLDRRVTLAVADHYFCQEEATLLKALPLPVQPEEFLRLWTLKEAFIKATGEGLSQDLKSFWFETRPPRIHFAGSLPERPQAWTFEQRIIDGRFVAAVGLRHAGKKFAIHWNEVNPGTFNPMPPRQHDPVGHSAHDRRWYDETG